MTPFAGRTTALLVSFASKLGEMFGHWEILRLQEIADMSRAAHVYTLQKKVDSDGYAVDVITL